MPIRLGDLLVSNGVLTPEQRDHILELQSKRSRPFGVLAEEMFGVDPQDVEQAWAAQYETYAEQIDPRHVPIESDVLDLIDRRQAWQFVLLPLRREDGGFVFCTTTEHLPRAMRFTSWRIPEPTYFVLADPDELNEALQNHYPLTGVSLSSIPLPSTAQATDPFLGVEG